MTWPDDGWFSPSEAITRTYAITDDETLTADVTAGDCAQAPRGVFERISG
jgi:hypothetical protein